MKFKKGMSVVKTFKGLGGYTEKVEQKIGKIKDGVIYLTDSAGNIESGITYDLKGKERENFFPGMTTIIEPKATGSLPVAPGDEK